ncbi:MAG: SRPBCC domain-containing protein [Chloroflexi bacterium]|nr:SRPBCC domain-containing protein [Chloroflexota bacterium]
MRRDLSFDRVYPHPPERVWQALTDSRAVAKWFADNDFAPVVGHKFRFRTDPGPNYDGILYCEVTEVDPPRRLVYTFIGGYMEHTTLVTWTLTPVAEGTHVRLEHTGFTGLTDVAVADILSGGWLTQLQRLAGVLDGLDLAGESPPE